jgi:hypothetical protein
MDKKPKDNDALALTALRQAWRDRIQPHPKDNIFLGWKAFKEALREALGRPPGP